MRARLGEQGLPRHRQPGPVARGGARPQTNEKLWIAAVDAFAIGGACQYMLVTDVNVATSDDYTTLPVREEGIIPGAAHLRVSRFVADRIARQAIIMERRIDGDSPEGRMVCYYVIEPGWVDQAVADIVAQVTSRGVVSASSNRRSFRVADESLDDLLHGRVRPRTGLLPRQPRAIRNLEPFWNA